MRKFFNLLTVSLTVIIGTGVWDIYRIFTGHRNFASVGGLLTNIISLIFIYLTYRKVRSSTKEKSES